MATQYRCANENRRDAVRSAKDDVGNPILNGIDYLEYLEVTDPEQKKLSVYFIHPLPGQPGNVPTTPILTDLNFVVEGGVRITDIKATPPLSTAANVVTLLVNQAGDYSTYTLRLVSGDANDAPPAGFDPQLSTVDFSFKVDCPSEFDCTSPDDCPPDDLPAPSIDYMAKDYSSFRRLMLDRLSTLMPGWRERHAADLQIALVETIAYVGDQLSYYQDAVGTEAYLGTARQRVSVRRHARLLDYYLHEGCNARAWVCFEVKLKDVVLPEKSRLLTRGFGFDTVIDNKVDRVVDGVVESVADDEKVLQRILTQETPLVFETFSEINLYSAHNKIRFYTWDNSECCLPKGATRATLLNDPDLPLQLQPGDILIFEEVTIDKPDIHRDADPAHRHAVRLIWISEAYIDPLYVVNPAKRVIDIEWDAQDALPFPLCISATLTDAQGVPHDVPDISVAHGNVVLADHGRTIAGEELEPVSFDSGGHMTRLAFKQEPLTYCAPFDPESPAVSAMRWEMRDVKPSAWLIEKGIDEKWCPRFDLLASGPFERHFVVETENDGTSGLRFGDGVYGQRPVEGLVFLPTYRIGNGPVGNVGAEAITRVIADKDCGILSIRNPLPAYGGTAPEPLEQVRQYAPQAFRTQERAVTPEDYARAAERHPEVQKAAATLRWTGSWHTVFITVDRLGGCPVDALFERKLRAFLERFRLAGQDVEIDAPRFIPLEIVFSVCVKPGYYRSQVKAHLLSLFSNRTSPHGIRGFFHPDHFTFGQPVYLSRMIEQVMSVPGVQWVDAEDIPGKPNRFRRWGQVSRGEFSDGKISFGRLEIAQLDNDPSLPENGKIDFIMEGGL